MRRSSILWPIVVLIVALVAVGSRSDANRHAPARPSVVATVNLEKLFEQLSERGKEDAELTRLAQTLQDQSKTQESVIGDLDSWIPIVADHAPGAGSENRVFIALAATILGEYRGPEYSDDAQGSSHTEDR